MNIKKWASLLDIQRLFGSVHIEFTKVYIPLFEQFAPASKYKRLLDVGCGEGPKELDLLAKEGYDVTGITLLPWMEKDDSRIKTMDMHDMKFPPESFDVIYSTQVMEHSYAPWLACLEIWITLRDSGIFFMVVPTPYMYKVVTHPNLLSQDQWEFILLHTGFEVIYNKVHTIFNQPLIVIVGQKAKPKQEIVQKALDNLIIIREEDK